MEAAEEILQPIVDGGYIRKMVRNPDERSRIMTTFTQHRREVEGEDDASWDEEYDSDRELVLGPCRRDYGHFGPDEEDRRYEYQYGEDGNSFDYTVTMEEFRKYNRPPILLPNTTQGTYYSTVLTGLLIAKQKAQTLRKNVKGLRFWDGSIPWFLEDSTKRVIVDMKCAINRVYDTIDKLKYDTNLLNINDAPKNPETVG